MKISRFMLLALVLVFLTSVIAACGGGGGGSAYVPPADTTPPPADTTPPPADAGPAITGFGFSLAEGDFFEFGWDYYKDGWSMSDHTITSTNGTFAVILGAPVAISGISAYPVSIAGISKPTGTDDFAPRWKFLAVSGNQVLGSVDGVTLEVIFDAQNGNWAGGGFFTAFPADTLITATSATLSNNYISTSAIKAGRSSSLSQCEVILGITICGDNSFNMTEYEYYKAGIGPIGYEYYNTFSDCGGGFCSGATWDHKIGLMASSLRGDLPSYELEIEPNDSSLNAQLVSISGDLYGDIHSNDTGSTDRRGMKTEDWFKVSVIAPATLTIKLDFTGSDVNTDLDMYLFGGRVISLLDKSIGDNAASGVQTESITYAFTVSGTYYVGINAFNTPARIEYALSVN